MMSIIQVSYDSLGRFNYVSARERGKEKGGGVLEEEVRCCCNTIHILAGIDTCGTAAVETLASRKCNTK